MPGWLAIVVREETLEAAYVERRDNRPAVKWTREMPFDGEACTTIGHLRRNLARRKYRCTTLMPRGSYQNFEVPAPKVERAEWRDALRWVIKDDLEYPIDQAIIETMPIPHEGAPPGREPMTYVIAARRDIVTRHVRWFQRGGLPLHVISTANVAQRNVAALFETPGRALAFIGVYRRGVVITFTCNGSIYASRQLMWALPLLRDDAEPEAHRVQCERAVLDVQRALDNFDRQFSYIALQRVLLAVPPGHVELTALFRRSLTLAVEVADLSEKMDLSACPGLDDPAEQSRWILVIGMGLYREEAT